jgi:hypothetical protein
MQSDPFRISRTSEKEMGSKSTLTASRRRLSYGVQLDLMGVRLGGTVIWTGVRGRGCDPGTADQHREAVTVLP